MKKGKRRQRIDTMIDAHVWMRADARKNGEWPRLPRSAWPDLKKGIRTYVKGFVDSRK